MNTSQTNEANPPQEKVVLAVQHSSSPDLSTFSTKKLLEILRSRTKATIKAQVITCPDCLTATRQGLASAN